MTTQRSPRLRGDKNWLEPQDSSTPEALHEALGGHPLVAQTLSRRGINDPETARAFIDPTLYTPALPIELPGLSKAADLVQAAIRSKERILVWGDFDVDGQTATTLLVEALQDLEAEVTYYIPIRATEGHGINIDKLQELITSSSPPALLLTCDTGIAAHEAVEHAKGHGLTVVITDHHDLPPELPKADAIINSKLAPEGHPLSTLPGVGVAFKLVEELYQRFERPPTQTHKYLDLVALGIVADVALQTGDARYLLQRGLQVLRHTRRLGLQTLMQTAELIPDQIDEGHIGFSIGPRLNALGRLSDANPIVEFLTTEDSSRARILATQLEGLNNKRKLLTDQIYQAALSQVERDPTLLEYAALVLAHPQWPTGVIGIVASRLVERFNKPTILLSSPEGEPARGSARSVEGIHITEAIAAQAEMLLGFGGHPMAAGISLEAQRIPEFHQSLSRTIRAMIGEALPEEGLQIDAYLRLDTLSLDLIDDLERLAPFGAGNPSLTLATRDLELVSHTPIGRDKQHLRLVVADQQSNTQDVLWWRGAEYPLPEGRFDLAYTASSNTFRGDRRVQVEWLDYRQMEETHLEAVPEAPDLQIFDHRQETHPLPVLEQIQSQGKVLLYTEGEAKSRLGGRDRNEVGTAEKLVLWTCPPGPQVLQTLIEQTNPEHIFLFGIDPNLDQPETFLARLAGLVKHTLKAKDARTTLNELAAAMAHRPETVRMGLAWLEEKGHLSVEEANGNLTLSADGTPGHALDDIALTLKLMLDETAAYREYFKRANATSLFRDIETADKYR